MKAGLHLLMRVINWIGYVSISFIILVTFTNVIGRYILRKPLIGEIDMVELGMAVFGGVAMLMAALDDHHVRVDVLFVHFPHKTRKIFDKGALILGFITWTFLAYRSLLDGLDKLNSGSSTATLLIPQGPFEVILSILIFIFAITLLVQIFRPKETKIGE